MTTPTNSALHMMEGQGLSDAQIVAIAAKAYAEGRMSWLGFEKDEDGYYTIPVLSGSHFQLVRAVLESVHPKTALSHFADEVEASGEAEKHAAEIIGDEDAAIRAWWTKEGLALPVGTKLYATSADAVASLKEELAKAYELFARERGITKELAEALRDMNAGWKYIRNSHGDLYGVGWDRAQDKADAALSKVQQ